MRPHSERQYELLMCVCVDVLLSILCCYVVSAIGWKRSFLDIQLAQFAFFKSLILILFLAGFDMYSIISYTQWESAISTVLSHLYTLIIVCMADVFLNAGKTWLEYFVSLLVSGVVLTTWRGLYIQYRNTHHPIRLLIVESSNPENSRARKLKYNSLDRYDSWYELFSSDDLNIVRAFIKDEMKNFDVVCLMNNISDAVRKEFMAGAIYAEKNLFVVPDAYDIAMLKQRHTRLDDVLMFNLPALGMNMGEQMAKRFMDIAISLAMLSVAAIPMAILAVLVKLTSPGPIFYKQVRLTRSEKEFMILKFRSMVQDAESKLGPVLATKNDPRVTPLGKFMRKTRLDELPQLINVLKGEMSLVGPRPERPFFVEQFKNEIEMYTQRFRVKAGLTSLSHVYGRYSTDIADRTIYDLMYIRDYSLLMDIRILLLTSKIMFQKDAAEGVDKPAASKENVKA